MDISNTSSMTAQNLSHLSTNEATKMERTEIADNCWQDNAADAVCKAFNEEDFVSSYKESRLFDEA